MLGRAQPVSGTWAGVGEQSLLSQAAATGHHPHHGDPTTSNPRSPGLRWDQPWAAWTPHPNPKEKGRGFLSYSLGPWGHQRAWSLFCWASHDPTPASVLWLLGLQSSPSLGRPIWPSGCWAMTAEPPGPPGRQLVPAARALCPGCQATVL